MVLVRESNLLIACIIALILFLVKVRIHIICFVVLSTRFTIPHDLFNVNLGMESHPQNLFLFHFNLSLFLKDLRATILQNLSLNFCARFVYIGVEGHALSFLVW